METDAQTSLTRVSYFLPHPLHAIYKPSGNHPEKGVGRKGIEQKNSSLIRYNSDKNVRTKYWKCCIHISET